jgi:Fic family protein
MDYNRLMTYNWQQPDWPEFQYDLTEVQDVLFSIAEKTGQVSGALKGLPDDIQTEAMIDWMVCEAIKTSEIEGEYLSRQDVMSSIRNNLGLNPSPERVHDGRAQGVADLMVDVRQTFAEPLTQEKLFAWHQMLLGSQADAHRLSVGQWRTHPEPMQVVSGRLDRPRVHYEGPPSQEVPQMMARFIAWFNATAPGGANEIKPAPVRAAVAHLYFESIHPFEDGNGRIGRAISEKALAQGLGRPVLLSLSQTIETGKKAYYDALEKAQKSNKITDWIIYFVNTVLDAQNQAEAQVEFILLKTKFFDRFKDQFNDRQVKVIKRMLQEGPEGFSGDMTAKKYVSLTGVSKATATRDLQYLAQIGAFAQTGSGRNVRYEVKLK